MDNEPTINLTGTELLSTLTAAQVDHVSRGLELACGCELFARGGRLWLGGVGTPGGGGNIPLSLPLPGFPTNNSYKHFSLEDFLVFCIFSPYVLPFFLLLYRPLP